LTIFHEATFNARISKSALLSSLTYSPTYPLSPTLISECKTDPLSFIKESSGYFLGQSRRSQNVIEIPKRRGLKKGQSSLLGQFDVFGE